MNWLLLTAGALFISLSFLNVRLFGTLLTPVYLTFAIEFFLRSLLGYLAYYYLFPSASTALEFLDEALALSMLYSLAYYAGAALRNPPIERLIMRLSRASITSADDGARRIALSAAIATLAAGLASLIGLAILGGGGALWITDTRSAYLSYRTGAGFLWSAFASSVPISLLTLAHLYRPKAPWLWLLAGPGYVVLAYFTGSKQTILAVVLSLLYYHHCYVRRIATGPLVAIFVCLLVTFLASTILQGSFESFAESLSYFDYINMSARYLEVRDALSDINGSSSLSYLWSFVPRLLVPNKPHEYGIVLINSYLFPGAAEQGYTPAYLEWTLMHLNFAGPGVALLGFLKGQFVASSLRVFEQRKENLFLFLFSCHLGFMIFNTPGIYELPILLSLGLAWVLRKAASVKLLV